MSEQADHRKLGRALKLFASEDVIGPGLPVWLPNGAMIRSILERYVVDMERAVGYQHVYSPVLAKRELYERSGHWQHYHEDMFPPMKVGSDEVVLRPMLCPHHVLVINPNRAATGSCRCVSARSEGNTATSSPARSAVYLVCAE